MADPESISVRFSFRKKPLPPTQDLVAEANRIYAYDTDNGGLVWKAHKNPKRPWPLLGTAVGGDDGRGYKMCLLLGHKFKVHQIVWMLNYGYIPSLSIDHIDGDRRNNKISNLRIVTDHQNSMNLSASKGKLSGIKDLSKHRSNLKCPYAAVVQHNGKKHYFGFFQTKEAARDAYIAGKRFLCGEHSPV